MSYQPAAKMAERIDNDFTYHAPHGDQSQRYQAVRETLKGVAKVIVRLTPASREQSLALTALEEAMFYANAAIARNEGPEAEEPVVVPLQPSATRQERFWCTVRDANGTLITADGFLDMKVAQMRKTEMAHAYPEHTVAVTLERPDEMATART